MKKAGFTLIEILVVVLIIGILGAIAVPQYQQALLKSRFSSVIPPTKAIADAQEFHYLNNGEYAEETDELDITPQQNSQTDIVLSDMKNYKFVMGSHEGVPDVSYIVYQKHSKRFADNIHCEAAKDNAMANWLCETGLGGTLIPGSLGGSDYLTYVISGDPGTDKFLREDCPAGRYDNNGTCTQAPTGYYADEGELKTCQAGTYTGVWFAASECKPCPAGQYSDAGAGQSCTSCPAGTTSQSGAGACTKCPAGTYTNNVWLGATQCEPCPAGQYSEAGAVRCTGCPAGTTSQSGAGVCTKCPAGTYTGVWSGASECKPCPVGKYSDAGAGPSCNTCPSGTTNNEDHTDCVPV